MKDLITKIRDRALSKLPDLSELSIDYEIEKSLTKKPKRSVRDVILEWQTFIKAIILAIVVAHTIWCIWQIKDVLQYSSDVQKTMIVLDVTTAFKDDNLDKEKLQSLYKSPKFNKNLETYLDNLILNIDNEDTHELVIKEMQHEGRKLSTAVIMYLINMSILAVIILIIEFVVPRKEKQKAIGEEKVNE